MSNGRLVNVIIFGHVGHSVNIERAFFALGFYVSFFAKKEEPKNI